MDKSIPGHQSQELHSQIKDTNVSGDLIFAPKQIGTNIETQIVIISAAKVTQQPLIKNSPYQGLKRFNVKDRDSFFGRDTLIARLFEAVNRSALSIVLGASGSGKSSVVRAGLTPELMKTMGSQPFYDFIFTPNQNPFDSLYRCLLNDEKDYSFSKSEAEIALKAKADTLSEVIRSLRKDGERWLIFVDQFEELFTICDDPDMRKNFISALVQAAKSGNSYVKIILAMRSDFLEQFSYYPDLVAIANHNNIHVVAEMQPDELRMAIEQPAAKHGVVFEDGLVELIIKEVEGQKGYLPLLQYTLNLLWESECQALDTDGRPTIESRILNKRSYRALEGVRGALQQHVNEIYRHFNQEEQAATKQVLLSLVDFVDSDFGKRAVSKRAYRYEFVGESTLIILNKFIDENLLVSSNEYSHPEQLNISDGKRLKQSATVEIAHEILLSSWDVLKRWLEQEKEAIILLNWLTSETRRWQRIRLEDETKAQDELLKGSRLAQIVEFRDKDAFKNVRDLSQQEEEFINASTSLRNRLEREREERRKQVLYVSLGAATLMGALAGFAGWQWREAALAQIQSLTTSSATLLASHQGIKAMVDALQADSQLSNPILLPDDTTHKQARLALQQAVYERGQQNQLEGHDYSVRGVSFSPVSQMIATASEDGTVRLWSSEGKELDKVTAPNQRFRTVTFNPDGTFIAAISANNTIRVWRIEGRTMKEAGTANGDNTDNNFMSGICFIPKSSKIVSSGPNNTVNIWHIKAESLQLVQTLKGHDFAVWSISCSNDGKIVTADLGGNLGLWNTDGKELIKPFKVRENDQSIFGVSFSPDGKAIAIARGDTTVELWSRRDGYEFEMSQKDFKILGNHINFVTSVSFNQGGNIVVSTSADNTVKLWNRFGEVRGALKTLQGHGDRVYAASFSHDGKTLASAGDDNTVRLWGIGDLEPKTFQGHAGSLYSVDLSPNGRIIASAGDDRSWDPITIRLWGLDGQKLRSIKQPFKPDLNNGWNRVWSLRFSPDGQMIASANSDKTIKIWALNGQLKNILEGHDEEVIDVEFSPKAPILASASYDGKVKLWGMDSKRNFSILKTFNGRAGKVRSISFSPDGKTIASAHDDGTINIWQVDGSDQQVPKIIKGHDSYVTDVLFSPDGKTIASASRDKSIKLWGPDGQRIRTLQGHKGEINRLTYSRDGKILASASNDHTIRVWDVANGQELRAIQGEYAFFDVRISADSKKVFGVTDDALVQSWNLETLDLKRLREKGCEWLRDYFSSHKIDQDICPRLG